MSSNYRVFFMTMRQNVHRQAVFHMKVVRNTSACRYIDSTARWLDMCKWWKQKSSDDEIMNKGLATISEATILFLESLRSAYTMIL